MSRILAVHGSPRGERSHSRRLTEGFLQAWLEAHPQGQLTRREVGRASLPHVSEAFVAAAFYPEPQARPLSMQADLALSDELVTELLEHELLVISAPMYNFSVPSGLKAWVDQIVRLGLTFNTVQDNGIAQYEPLVRGKKALIVTSRGGFGFGPGGELEAMNHADPWLRTALGFIGIDDVTVVAAEGEESAERTFQVSCAEAEQRLLALARTF
ncbi:MULTISPECIES: FMN-dependent NADH-azoreductase [Pseudomonas]|uniref:FMN-dependent NADH-azoreductase n=1 Tax=Pseudomonas TaxID=286 RepID=UPI0006A58038|nr:MULTISPECIES: NAD(P)H-dependent oxidoreductase [Pseudomonas]AVO56975.1 FMN-dependent NADH-azoreductase [Pseudomonas chlororaphis subsp. piscium]AZC28615.1 FMN-dependent NADH-azoreductase [Pseudomonas chlororaphis subsp. piscium]PMY48052.1 FMN-dependent NADH-azoreductase [Pseudomonas sp. FW306-2-2C-D06C]PYC34104.1 FMN-dependent NADH-azoreductase [Pseudomonas chlororaphis]QTT91189.1 NAD(P)H-dependent oxidoreductase [Pseudomonas chlororaphis]